MKFLKRKPELPITDLPMHNCENCETEFQGRFCPNCGQEVAEFDKPFGFMIYDFMGNFFAFDTRFLTTFKYLLFRPGYLTAEFFKGRRARYSPPFRIFVFLSFIMFLLLQMLSDKAITDNYQSAQIMADSLSTAGLFKPLATIDKTGNPNNITPQASAPNTDTVKMFSDNEVNLNLNIGEKGSFRNELERQAGLYEKELSKTSDANERRKIQKYITMLQNPEMVVSNILKYLSWAFFILLPLFALILKLFFLRKNRKFIHHLIYSIHLHSFKFFMYSLTFGLALIFGEWFFGLLFTLTVNHNISNSCT